MIRSILGVLGGLALALVLVIAVELYSAVVHPMPPGAAESMAAMCEHVARYPQWVLATVVGLWGGAGFLSTWVASRIGGRGAGVALGLILMAALVFNLGMLPYSPWFKAVMPVALLLAGGAGARLGARRERPTAGA